MIENSSHENLFLPESFSVLVVGSVDVTAVQQVGDLVHLLTIAEGTAELGRGQGPHERHASLSVLHEEWVVLGDLDGEALWVSNQLADGSGSVVCAALDTVPVAIAQPGAREVQ